MAAPIVSKAAKAKLPSATKTAKKSGASRVKKLDHDAALRILEGLMAEKKPVVPRELLYAVERDINGAGVHAVHRRAALAYLSTPFKKIADKIRIDRAAALSFARIALCVDDSAERYKELAQFMETAVMRIKISLAQREDMLEILAIAEAQNDREAA